MTRDQGAVAVTRADVARLLGVDLGPDDSESLREVSSIADAGPASIVFATDTAALDGALRSRAGLILVSATLAGGQTDRRLLVVKEARLAFAQVYGRWFDRRGTREIHARSYVDASAKLGPGCEVGAGAVIEAGAQLGTGCVIGASVVIHGCCKLGDRVRVQAGAVLGSDGFGYARAADGFVGFPQIGTLVVGDDVEIGANTTIDRGALGETRIGRGTKIDNLCHIAHNCVLGEHVILAAQVGMAGSTVIEDHAMLGGQVGLGERVTIGRGVVLGGQGGVLPGKRLDGDGEVFWGTPARPVRAYLRDLARLRKG